MTYVCDLVLNTFIMWFNFLKKNYMWLNFLKYVIYFLKFLMWFYVLNHMCVWFNFLKDTKCNLIFNHIYIDIYFSDEPRRTSPTRMLSTRFWKGHLQGRHGQVACHMARVWPSWHYKRVLKDFRWFIRHHSSVVESAALKKVSNP